MPAESLRSQSAVPRSRHQGAALCPFSAAESPPRAPESQSVIQLPSCLSRVALQLASGVFLDLPVPESLFLGWENLFWEVAAGSAGW